MADPKRTYTYVEVAFFHIWWNEQTEAVRENVRMLVREGRLDFTNGGWCMNDQASTHYSSIIDNMQIGAQWLQAQFGASVRPTAGWMIDPFGQSAGQAWLYAKMGLEMFFFGRAPPGTPTPYHFLWKPFKSFLGNKEQDIYTYSHNGYCSSPPDASNAAAMQRWAEERRHDAVLLRQTNVINLYGCDFTRPTFSATDAAIKYVKEHPELGVELFYSTPVNYYKSVHEATFPLDAFEPPNDDFNPYWTGYYTSRQDFKQHVHERFPYYHAATALHALAPRSPARWTDQVRALNIMWQALGVVVHHDGLTGTSLSFVYDDYEDRLKTGQIRTADVMSDSISTLLPTLAGAHACDPGRYNTCPGTEGGVSSGGAVITVLNPLSWMSSEHVHI
jgi:lysosomal alpha-mannosidase